MNRAQIRRPLRGIVNDETGARLQDVTVTITHVLNGRAMTVNTGPAASPINALAARRKYRGASILRN